MTRLGNNDALGAGPVRLSGGRRSDPATFDIFVSPQVPDQRLIRVYWLRDPGLRATVRVSGMRISDRAPVTFEKNDVGASKILMPDLFVPAEGFDIAADVLVIPGPGCIAIDIQVDGTDHPIVVRAVEQKRDRAG